MNNRLNYIDIAKGIGIILVVIGHSIPGKLGLDIVPFIYSFHMPLFFILSGMFLSVDKYTICEFAFKRAKQLLLPTFYFTIITILIRYPIGHLDFTSFQTGLPGVLWFLPTLYLSQLIIMIAFKKFRQTSLRIGIVCVLFLLAFFLNNSSIPYSLISSIVASAYVGLGFIFNSTHFIMLNSMLGNFCKAVLFFLILFMLNKVFHIVVDMRLNVLTPFFVALITSVIGTFMVIRISMFIDNIKMGDSILRYLGINSLIIMVIHHPIRYIYEYLFQGVITNFLVYGILKQVFVWTICVLAICMINNKFKFLIGK